jgi:hypothetical protein
VYDLPSGFYKSIWEILFNLAILGICVGTLETAGHYLEGINGIWHCIIVLILTALLTHWGWGTQMCIFYLIG